jgi:aspartokinase
MEVIIYMPVKPVTSVSVMYDVALVTVDHLPNDIKLISEIFGSIASEKINIDMISQAPPYRNNINISFSLSSDDLIKAISALNRFKKKIPDLRIEVDANNTKLSVFGKEMKNIPGVAAKLFTIMANNGIDIKLVTTSEVDISYLIYEKDVDKAIQSIKTEYELV